MIEKLSIKKLFLIFLKIIDIGVKGISFVSDGESTISPVFVDAVRKGAELGISMATGTNGFVLTKIRRKKSCHI